MRYRLLLNNIHLVMACLLMGLFVFPAAAQLKNVEEKSEPIWFVYSNEKYLGPYAQQRILSMIQSGKVKPPDKLAEGGGSNWITVEEFMRLATSSTTRVSSDLSPSDDTDEAAAEKVTAPVENFADNRIGVSSELDAVIKQCSRHIFGKAEMEIRKDSTGRIIGATFTGELQNTPAAECVSRIIQQNIIYDSNPSYDMVRTVVLGGNTEYNGPAVHASNPNSVNPRMTESAKREWRLSNYDIGLPDDQYFVLGSEAYAKRKKFRFEASLGEVGLETGFVDAALYALFARVFFYFGKSNLGIGTDLFRGTFFSNDQDLMSLGISGDIDYIQLELFPITLKYSIPLGKKNKPIFGLDIFGTGSVAQFEGIEWYDDNDETVTIKDYEYSPMVTFGMSLNGPLINMSEGKEALYLTRLTVGYSVGNTDIRNLYAFDGLFLQVSAALGAVGYRN
ncbi:MAG: hypothetical protein JXX29_11145 [Deltaproteobacteria bacterium]|nr:hypothetical protein [Deltaproteobacteria bacterium]MBN2672226.1 hypothetical protein [Deltaproteobacteria bacterium]